MLTPERRCNLERLLAPRHIALIGGRDAEIAAGECARIGFNGPVWGINPKRERLGNYPCFRSIDDLPDAPDAVFLAVPRNAAAQTVRQLYHRGAGGVVCYTAGYGETGAEGARAQQELIEAAGDLALVGPNCYGIISYASKAALWPFAHGPSTAETGCAIVTQSGMLASDMTMSQRSVPFVHVISAGNQAVLAIEDFVDALVDRPEVRAIGVHIEGLRDVEAFSVAADKALVAGVPIVALKSGTSRVGAKLTESHTGSLSGTDDVYQALFNRLGIIRVHTPAQMLETLKFVCIAGVPKGCRVAGFTCSGGGAAMLADLGEPLGLQFTQPAIGRTHLTERLPDIATVSNPLDYTTPIWGDIKRVPPVFEAMFEDPCDAAMLVQDYPLAGLDDGKQFYLNDAMSFMAETGKAQLPAAVCATLPENLDGETRKLLLSGGVAPLQGISEALTALSGAIRYGRHRQKRLTLQSLPWPAASGMPAGATTWLDEGAAKERLLQTGLPVPRGRVCNGQEAVDTADKLGYPVALKMLSDQLKHKSEAGAVALSLSDGGALSDALEHMRKTVTAHAPDAVSDRFLVEAMAPASLAELLVSFRRDPQFGIVMVVASGGILVELASDSATLLWPASAHELDSAINRLKVSRIIDGFRGRPRGDKAALLDCLTRLGRFIETHPDIAELETNPVMVHETGVTIADALMQVTNAKKGDT